MSCLNGILRHSRNAAVFALVLVVALSEMRTTAEDKLSIGSVAPPLSIEHWIQDGKGKFKPVTKMEKGKIYIVEFWATWCGPCIASMPHLAETQVRLAKKGVQIISISTESLDTIDQFLDRKVNNSDRDNGQTYRQLTSAYCLTTDPDESTYEDYMGAAGQDGIPCAFIVGKDQRIEWIGHPGEMDDVLDSVIADRWDRKAFADAYAENKANEEWRNQIEQALQSGKAARAIALIDAALGKTKNAEFIVQLRMTRVSALFQMPKLDKEMKAAIEQALTEFKADPDFVNFVAWSVFEKANDGDWKDKELVRTCRIAIEKVLPQIKDDPTKASALETISHLQYLDGDLPGAIKSQQAAVQLATGDYKRELEKFLRELQSKK